MRNLLRFTVVGLVSVACVSSSSGSPSGSGNQAANEDERGSVGPAHPGWKYCTDLGYTTEYGRGCIFPDGTSCDPVLFWDGRCGQQWTYCETHGGKISREPYPGSESSVYAACTIDGRRCAEDDFAKTHHCGD